MAQSIVVLGARNLGGAIVDHFLGLGWNAAAVARREETLDAVRSRGVLGVSADASDGDSLTAALSRVRAEQAFTFLSVSTRALRESGGGTLVQITGRRVIAGFRNAARG